MVGSEYSRRTRITKKYQSIKLFVILSGPYPVFAESQILIFTFGSIGLILFQSDLNLFFFINPVILNTDPVIIQPDLVILNLDPAIIQPDPVVLNPDLVMLNPDPQPAIVH